MCQNSYLGFCKDTYYCVKTESLFRFYVHFNVFNLFNSSFVQSLQV